MLTGRVTDVFTTVASESVPVFTGHRSTPQSATALDTSSDREHATINSIFRAIIVFRLGCPVAM
jgi:hypothetical protein